MQIFYEKFVKIVAGSNFTHSGSKFSQTKVQNLHKKVQNFHLTILTNYTYSELYLLLRSGSNFYFEVEIMF